MSAPHKGCLMQHKLLTVVAGAAAIGLVWTISGEPSAQVRRAPVPAASATPTGSSGAPAREAAYGETAGQGRADTPSTAESQPATAGFGRPNPGRPEFEDPDYRGGEGSTGARSDETPSGPGNANGRGQGGNQGGNEGQAQNQGQGQGQNGDGAGNAARTNGNASDEDATVLQVADGFFFDNYTSGSGFGVYGGEAVTSGSGEQSNPRQDLPSAGIVFRNLGIQP